MSPKLKGISLTEFVDVVSASSGPSKTNKIAEIKQRRLRGYSPALDFWKRLRDGIINVHETGGRKDELDRIMTSLPRNKRTAYPPALAGYKKFWGRKRLDWFQPPKSSFGSSGFEVAVNPELGLEIDGTPHVIKLYFKAEKLTKLRMDVILHLMEHVFSSSNPGAKLAVLDVQRSNLILSTVKKPRLHVALQGELAFISTVWSRI